MKSCVSFYMTNLEVYAEAVDLFVPSSYDPDNRGVGFSVGVIASVILFRSMSSSTSTSLQRIADCKECPFQDAVGPSDWALALEWELHMRTATARSTPLGYPALAS